MMHTFIHTGVSNISDCSSFNNIPNDKLLNCLVFRDTASTVGATDKFHMSTSMFGPPTITPFLSLKNNLKLRDENKC